MIDNSKNKLYYAVNDISLNDFGLLSDCLYTNVNDIYKHPILKLISAVTIYKESAALN